MQFREALREYADLLRIGTDALRELAGSQVGDQDAGEIAALLEQTNDIAKRLRALADDDKPRTGPV